MHDLAVNRGVNFGDVNARNLWKFDYGVRNEASYQWHHVDKAAALRFAQRVHRGLKEGHVSRRLRLELAKKFLEGLQFRPEAAVPEDRPLTSGGQPARVSRSRRPARVSRSHSRSPAQVAAADEEVTRTARTPAAAASACPAGT